MGQRTHKCTILSSTNKALTLIANPKENCESIQLSPILDTV